MDWQHSDKINTSILRVSKQVYDEAVGFLYAAVDIKLNTKDPGRERLRNFLNTIGPRNHSNITRFYVRFEWKKKGVDNGVVSGMLRSLCRVGPRPPRIVISIGWRLTLDLEDICRDTECRLFQQTGMIR